MSPLLPSKHVHMHESLLGISALILHHVGQGVTVDELWRFLAASKERKFPRVRTDFDTFILALDLTFGLGAIHLSESGKIVHASS